MFLIIHIFSFIQSEPPVRFHFDETLWAADRLTDRFRDPTCDRTQLENTRSKSYETEEEEGGGRGGGGGTAVRDVSTSPSACLSPSNHPSLFPSEGLNETSVQLSHHQNLQVVEQAKT